MNKLEKFALTLHRFVPDGFQYHLAQLIVAAQVKFKIVNGRKTKLGDFRIGPMYQLPIITVNGDLNKYAFLITALHELAHLNTFKKFGSGISPHGLEWKNEYRNLLLPIIYSKNLPKDLEDALLKSVTKIKAASCSDIQLSRVLQKYDKESKDATIHLEDITEGLTFSINGKCFTKGKLRRSRYLCYEIITNRPYLIHRFAKIKIT
ncbi:MAG: hypothetical protein FJZ66_02220 [Bacteroidetes bacterium]|nr:hypothetical protein [Bacteroidota bacterium]